LGNVGRGFLFTVSLSPTNFSCLGIAASGIPNFFNVSTLPALRPRSILLNSAELIPTLSANSFLVPPFSFFSTACDTALMVGVFASPSNNSLTFSAVGFSRNMLFGIRSTASWTIWYISFSAGTPLKLKILRTRIWRSSAVIAGGIICLHSQS